MKQTPIHMTDMSVNLCGVTLRNPVIPASGCFGFGYEMASCYDLNLLGSIALKGTTLEPRFGNPLPRVAECPAGLLNSVGLQNPGVEKVIGEELPKLAKVYSGPLIANVSGFTIDEYAECCRRFDEASGIDIIELNVSCPNVHGGGMSFGTTCEGVSAVTSAARKATSKPLIVKLTPNTSDITGIALAARDAGADGFCLINTLLGMRIDLRRRRPVLANIAGGYSGPGIFPVALRMVHAVAGATGMPVIGCGGVSSGEDVIEMMMAGAVAVEVGAANLIDPMACPRIIEETSQTMERLGITHLSEIIGAAL